MVLELTVTGVYTAQHSEARMEGLKKDFKKTCFVSEILKEKHRVSVGHAEE